MKSGTGKRVDEKKKRPGRKRLPPLAPGPSLQFVVASHPEEFKEGYTMRNVRSHVMYKHRSKVAKSPSPKASSPGPTSRARAVSSSSLLGVPEGPSREASVPLEEIMGMQHRSPSWDADAWLSMPDYQTSYAGDRSSSVMLYGTPSSETSFPSLDSPGPYTCDLLDPLPDMPRQYSGDLLETTYDELANNICNGHGRFQPKEEDSGWLKTICESPLSFTSHISVASVYQDVANGLLDDSPLTSYAKTKSLRQLTEKLHRQSDQPDNYLILGILHLLISEVGSGSGDVFDVHQEGLIRIINQGGGMERLGIGGLTATAVVLIMLAFSIIRGTRGPEMFLQFIFARRSNFTLREPPSYSPIYGLQGGICTAPRSSICSERTHSLLCDMQDLTSNFILRSNSPPGPYGAMSSYSNQMQQIYTCLLQLSSTEDTSSTTEPDWIYESCRLAALIYCRSIIHRVPLSDSANMPHAHIPEPTFLTNAHYLTPPTLISALHAAFGKTDITNCWGDMSGVFLWVCFIGGAASWGSADLDVEAEHRSQDQISKLWMRKCFALHALKASLVVGFGDPEVVVEAQRTMLRVQSLIAAGA